MSKRSSLLKSIAGIITDYRAGEIEAPTPEHVDMWIKQFDADVQEPVLQELDHVLNRTYLSKANVQEFLSSLVKNEGLAGGDPRSFWKTVKFLNIQGGGNSQREMLRMFEPLLKEQCGLDFSDCGRGSGPDAYVYLDDGIFTGNRIRNDINAWLLSDAPQNAKVHVVTMALHLGGEYYAMTGIQKAAQGVGKKLDLHWWRAVSIEDRKAYIYSSDVLRPTSLPDDELTRQYVASLKYAPVLRRPGSVGSNKFFSSEQGRHLLEQELLKAGERIRSMCPYLNVYQRPLGNMVLETLGFGSLIVTFRNCPNNCPLGLWAGDPWYPLFPRKTN